MQGWKTFFGGLSLIIVPPALEYAAKVDWNALVGAKYAFVVSGVLMIAMRAVTNSGIFTKGPQ